MEVWERNEADRPSVFSGFNFAAAAVVHVVFFGGVWALNGFSVFKPEKAIPIKLTIVVNENLDGVENEPPPLDDPVPPPPPPRPKPPEPKKEPEKPKELEKIATNIVKKAERKKEPEKKKEEQKAEPEKKEPKPPEPPAKTAKELREERIKKMRESVKDQKKVKIKVEDQPSGNGRTQKQTMSADEIKKKLGEGYRPGTKTQLAESEEQRCISLIQKAFYDKWDQVGRPAWTADLKAMVLRVKFGPGGRVAGYSLAVSSGDKKADNTVLKAANLVKAIGGLSDEFIARNKDGVDVRFKVTP